MPSASPPDDPTAPTRAACCATCSRNGWLLVKGGAEAREFTRPGYSGGPVATDAGVVGLLTEGDSDVRVREALVIPVRSILGAWPELQHIVSR